MASNGIRIQDVYADIAKIFGIIREDLGRIARFELHVEGQNTAPLLRIHTLVPEKDSPLIRSYRLLPEPPGDMAGLIDQLGAAFKIPIAEGRIVSFKVLVGAGEVPTLSVTSELLRPDSYNPTFVPHRRVWTGAG